MPRDGDRTIAQHILDGMRANGIRQLFCLPGVQNDPFFDAVVDARDWLEVIVTRHEQGCAYMAMGAAQATGRPAAMCMPQRDPTVANGVNIRPGSPRLQRRFTPERV